jgi:CTP:molybdopterin cytidylyltransferase MocA
VITVHRAAEARLLGSRVGPSESTPIGALVQPISRPLSLVLFGASPAAPPIVRMAKELGWKVTVADHRPIVAQDDRLAAADEIVTAPVEELPMRPSWAAPAAAVVMTHHYRRDLALLRELVPRRCAYLGLVGSRGRAERLVADLRKCGFAAEDLRHLRAPAGLDLGVDTPSEIALSIVSEMQAVLRRATGSPFRDRRGSIHDPTQRNAIVILAAGGSRRMGAPKQLLTIDGRSLVRRAAETAIAIGSAAVYVVAGAESDRIREELSGLPVEVIANLEWREGIASSIRAAIEMLERHDRPIEALAFMLCDQPCVSTDILRRLFEAHRLTRAPVVASRYPDGPGVPALFRAEMFGALKSLSGDIGARQLIRSLDREVVTVPFNAFEDIDTPADFARHDTRNSVSDPSAVSVRQT